MSRLRERTYTGEPPMGRVLGGGFVALLGLTAIATLLLGGLMWVFTRGFFVLLS